MANSQDSIVASARPAPAIDRKRPTPPTGRRRLLALAAGATALATTATAAATEAEPLEQLWQEYRRADDLHTKACVVHGEAEDRAFEAHPPRPKILYGKRYGTDELFPLTLDHIERSDAARALFPGRHDRLSRAWNEWRAECAAVDAAHGVDRLDDETDALGFKLDAIIKQIVETPPRTLRGVRIKLMLADSLGEFTADSTVAELIVGLIADLKAATVGGTT